jgi:hypothetical protein
MDPWLKRGMRKCPFYLDFGPTAALGPSLYFWSLLGFWPTAWRDNGLMQRWLWAVVGMASLAYFSDPCVQAIARGRP